MPHSNHQPKVLNSELQNLIIQAKEHIEQDATGTIKKLVPEKHHGLILNTKPVFKMMGIPSPDIMLTSIFDSMANLPTEFWLELENMILGVITGNEESKEKLLRLIGAINSEHHNQA